jgi:hypothetical protein
LGGKTMDKTVGQYMKEASEIMQLTKEQKDVRNFYVPSGKFTLKCLLLYFLFMLVGVIIILLPIFLVESLFRLLTDVASSYSSLFLFLAVILFIAGGYSLSGFLMPLIVDIGTKKSKNRSILLFSLFCFFGVIAAIGLRIILSEYFDLRFDDILKAESLSNIVVVIGFVVTLIVTLVTAPKYIKNKPFCEKCMNYIPKTSTLYTQDSILMILPYLKSLKSNDSSIDLNNMKISSESIPNLKIDKYACPSCNNGFINLFWKYYIDKNTIKTDQIYSDCLSSIDFDKLNAIVKQ